MFTKHLSSRDRVESLMKLFNCEFREGRPDGAPMLKRDAPTEVHVMGEFADITDCDSLAIIPKRLRRYAYEGQSSRAQSLIGRTKM